MIYNFIYFLFSIIFSIVVYFLTLKKKIEMDIKGTDTLYKSLSNP